MGEKLRVAIWESLVDKGIGGWLAPWQLKRMGRASRENTRLEKLALIHLENEIKAIESGDKVFDVQTGRVLPSDAALIDDQGRVEPYIDTQKVVAGIMAQDTVRAIRSEINVIKAAAFAEDILNQDENDSIPQQSIDNDWLLTWRDCASRVSSDELQQLWGKLLAGEFVSPGSFSLRTLEFIKNLSVADAHLIGRLAPFVFDSNKIAADKKEILEKAGLSFDDLLSLQDLSVLTGVIAPLITIYKSTGGPVVISAQDKKLIFPDVKDGQVEYNVFILTKLGIELLSLSESVADTEYLVAMAKDKISQGLQVRVVGNVIQDAGWGVKIEGFVDIFP